MARLGSLGRAISVPLFALLAVSCSKVEREKAPSVDQTGPLTPRRVAFHPVDPDRLLIVEADGLVSVWRVADAQQPEKLLSIRARAVDAQFPVGREGVVSGGRDGLVRLWGGDGRETWRSSRGHKGEVRAVAAAPGRVASAGVDGLIRQWALDGSELGPPLAGHEGIVLSLAFSPGGDWLVSEGADTTLRLWPLRGGPREKKGARVFRDPVRKFRKMLPSLIKLDAQWGWGRSVAFSPRGSLLAAAGLDGTIRLWNLDGTPHGPPMKGHRGHHVRSIAFSPRGDRIATAGFDGTARLWNLDGSSHGEPFKGHRQAVTSVTFSKDGNRLATAGLDGTVRLWGLDGSLLGVLPKGSVVRQEVGER